MSTTRLLVTRGVLAVPTLVLLSVIIFGLLRLIPGDAVTAMVGESGFARPEDIVHLRAQFHLDDPLYVQFASWWLDILHGNLGTSVVSNRPVTSLIVERLPTSLEIALLTISMQMLIGIPAGLWSAARWRRAPDYIGRFGAILGLAIPDFFLGVLFFLVASTVFGWTPPINSPVLWVDPGANLALVLPAVFVLGFQGSARITRLMRTSALEVLGADFVRTAHAKGLAERMVIWRHVLKLTLIPIFTFLATNFGRLIGGLVIIESVFNIQGLGLLLLSSINQRDYPVIQGLVLLIGTFIILLNLTVDLVYAQLDPRIKYG
jgi:peptide/nickel transport system permease protein